MKPWHTSFVSHLLLIYIKKLELHQLIYTSLDKYEQHGKRFIARKEMWWIITISKANIAQMASNLAHGCILAWQWIFTLGVTRVVEKKMVILQFVMNRGSFLQRRCQRYIAKLWRPLIPTKYNTLDQQISCLLSVKAQYLSVLIWASQCWP